MKDLDSQARYAARKAGLIAHKSVRRRDTIDNHGEFMLIEPDNNVVVAGSRYDMTAQEVILFCSRV